MLRTTCLIVWGAFVLTGCDGGSASKAAVDMAAERQALLRTDSRFADRALEQGVVEAYEAFLAEDGAQLPDGGLPLEGKTDIMRNLRTAVEQNDFSLTWEPADARVAASGDLGYTWGVYFLETRDADGESFVTDGKYVFIWQKSAAGDWQVVLDISNQNEAPFPEDLEFDFGAEGAGES